MIFVLVLFSYFFEMFYHIYICQKSQRLTRKEGWVLSIMKINFGGWKQSFWCQLLHEQLPTCVNCHCLSFCPYKYIYIRLSSNINLPSNLYIVNVLELTKLNNIFLANKAQYIFDWVGFHSYKFDSVFTELFVLSFLA